MLFKAVKRSGLRFRVLCHKNVLRFIGVWSANLSDPFPYIVSPWMKYGNLENYILNYSPRDRLHLVWLTQPMKYVMIADFCCPDARHCQRISVLTWFQSWYIPRTLLCRTSQCCYYNLTDSRLTVFIQKTIFVDDQEQPKISVSSSNMKYEPRDFCQCWRARPPEVKEDPFYNVTATGKGGVYDYGMVCLEVSD